VDDQGSLASVVVVLADEIDISTAEAMREQLRSAFTPGVKVVIADMSGTGFCDTSGFRNLLIANDDAGAAGARLRVVVRAGAVRRALEVLGLDRVLSLYPDLQSARRGAL
jgi:anti-sigma B factor antagonist